MELLRQNLAYLFERRQTNPNAAADQVGVSQPTLHRLLNRPQPRPSADTLRKLADYFGVTVDDLLTRDLSTGLPAEAIARANVREGPSIKGLVPLLTSVQAGEWCEIAGTFQRDDARVWLPCPVKHGPRTFCLTVEGESMKNPGARPSYEPGDVIFVDPDVAAKPGDRVVARLESQVAATFKQYLEEDGRKLLKALNPDWQPRYIPINGDATICGVVIGKWVPE